jgi:2-polyprenyl-3-methyl-5-hydroxy-6-metoxy-1,4-benzoquinol methylase
VRVSRLASGSANPAVLLNGVALEHPEWATRVDRRLRHPNANRCLTLCVPRMRESEDTSAHRERTKESKPPCPACAGSERHVIRRHHVSVAAQHFIPWQRDRRRHEALLHHLHQLWGQDHVELHVCQTCRFGYAVPWIGGDARFYALVHAADPHYPADRWEFGQTLDVLRRPEFRRRLRVLEIGAGDGAFLDHVRDLREHEITAVDYDEGAVRQLHKKGYDAVVGSVNDVSTTGYDIVCLFQTLEHMADLDDVFAEIRRVLAPGGSVFLSVPNGQAIDFQERVTGYWDMPPNHVGRWNSTAIRRASERRGFTVLQVKTEPVQTSKIAWLLAVYSVNARACTAGTIDNRINAIVHRPARGVLKRLLAGTRLPRLLGMRGEFEPLTCWAHLQLEAEASSLPAKPM